MLKGGTTFLSKLYSQRLLVCSSFVVTTYLASTVERYYTSTPLSFGNYTHKRQGLFMVVALQSFPPPASLVLVLYSPPTPLCSLPLGALAMLPHERC